MSFFKKIQQDISGNKDHLELLEGAANSFFLKIAGIIVSLLFAFVVARLFGADTWGVFFLAFTYMTFGAILGSLGLDFSILKLSAGIGENDKASITVVYRSAFIFTIAVSAIVSVLFFVKSAWAASVLFGLPEMTLPFQLASLGIMPIAIINLNTNTLQGLKKITVFAFFRYISMNLIGLLFLIPLIYLISDASQIVITAFIFGLYFIAVVSQITIYRTGISIRNNNGNENNEKKKTRLLFKIALPLLFAGILLFSKNWIDSIMVGIFLTESDVGVYTIALKIAGLINIFFVSIGNIMAPKISEIYEKADKNRLEDLIKYSVKVSIWLTLPLLIIIILFSDIFLSLFGSDFSDGKNALIILAIGFFLNVTAGPVGHILNMTESQFAYQNITFAVVIVGIGLNFVLIPRYGIEGAAISNFLCLFIWNLVSIIHIKNKYHINTLYIPFSSKRLNSSS